MSARRLIAPLLMLAGCGAAAPPLPQGTPGRVDARPDMAAICPDDRNWGAPGPAVHIYGNVYHVGTCTITVLLITTPAGHILVDAASAEGTAVVLANIRSLGIDPRAVEWIVTSHEHYDHVGGLAALKAATGAKVAASRASAPYLASGMLADDDPQKPWQQDPFAPVSPDREMDDGDALSLGGTTLTMHATPAHAPGSTSWSWTSCDGSDCKRIAYLDSVTTPAPDGYRFSDHPARVAAFRKGIAAMAAIPCDILLTPHPGQSAMYERYAGTKPLVDPAGCAAYARAGGAAFDKRLAGERAGA